MPCRKPIGAVVCGLKALAVGLAMVLLLRVWGTTNLALLIIAGGAFYLPVALLIGVVPREDLNHIVHALRSRPKEGA